MTRQRLVLLAGSCLVGVLTAMTAVVAVPQVLRIVLGLSTVLIVPGFALVCAVLPERDLSNGERLLASVGMSLAITTCAAVLLGATPMGLSQLSIAVALTIWTLTFSTCAIYRARRSRHRPEGRGIASTGPEP